MGILSSLLKGAIDGSTGAERDPPHSYSDMYVWKLDVDDIREMEKENKDYNDAYKEASASRERGSDK